MLEEKTGYVFKDPQLLRLALTHRSYAAEHRGCGYNERLEFLGDSILGMITAHYVYQRLRDCDEGGLAKLKARLVSGPALAQWAWDIGIGEHLILGQGESSGGGRNRDSILADAVEALIGAIFVDGGYESARGFVESRLEKADLFPEETDFKSKLQESVQKARKTIPRYEITQTVGPEHDKTFEVAVFVGKDELGRGRGKSRKEAEQSAAKNALSRG
ncbi:MAG: ribonuclease III [Elusimicrobiales bacterium]